jgi:hypothetical protein
MSISLRLEIVFGDDLVIAISLHWRDYHSPERRTNMRRLSRICFLLTIIQLLWLACSCNWVDEVSSIIPVVGAAATAFIGLLTAFGAKVSPDLLSKVTSWQQQLQSDLKELSSLINQYDSADPGPAKDSILSDIETAANVIVSNFSAILPDLHVDNPSTQAKITAVANAILVQLQSIAALIPVAKGQAKIQAVANAGKLAMNAQQFTTHFNQILTHATGDPATDSVVNSSPLVTMPQTKP